MLLVQTLFAFMSARTRITNLDAWQFLDIILIGLGVAYLIERDQIKHVSKWNINLGDACLKDKGSDTCSKGKYETRIRNLLSFINLIMWLRCISFLRLFKASRIFIFMLVEVLKDLASFFFLLLFFVISFATSFSIMQGKRGRFFERMFEAFFDLWLLTFGEFEHYEELN